MAVFRKLWATQADIEGTSPSTFTTLADTTEEFSADIDLETSGHEGAHVEVQVSFGASPEFNVEINVYPSLDGTYDGQERSVMSIEVPATASDIIFQSLIVVGYAHCRLGFKQLGTVTNDAGILAYHQRWQWDDQG